MSELHGVPHLTPQQVSFSLAGTHLRWPQDPTSRYSHPGLWARPGDCYRIWQKVVGCHFCENVSGSGSWPLLPAHSDGSSCHVLSCLTGRPTWLGTEGQEPEGHGAFQPNSPQRSESCQHHVSELEHGSTWLTPPLQPVTDLRQRHLAKQIPTHRKCEITNVCCFKSLQFGVVCYAAIAN